MAGFVAIEMQTAVVCPECNMRSPLPGLRSKIACRACGSEIDVLEVHKQWHDGGTHYAFGSHYDAFTEAKKLGPGHELKDARDGQKAPVRLRSVELACPACKAKIEPPAEGASAVACACGEKIVVRWADKGTAEWDRRIWCVLGDAVDPAAGQPGSARLVGTVVQCAQCGAPLPDLSSRRNVVCDHCNTPNYLFDAVWLKIHPDANRHAFTLLYKVEPPPAAKQAPPSALDVALHEGGKIDIATARTLITRDLSAKQARRLDAALGDAERAQLVTAYVAPTLVDLWTHARDASTRAIAAAYAELAPDAVERLAEDEDARVRVVIAARSDVGVDRLKELRKDSDAAVAAAAKANPRYQPGLFGRLFGD